jgi:hypothetical protein
MSTAAFGLRPLPALSLTAAVMATTFGGCGCRPAPASTSAPRVDDSAVTVAPQTQAPARGTTAASL